MLNHAANLRACEREKFGRRLSRGNRLLKGAAIGGGRGSLLRKFGRAARSNGSSKVFMYVSERSQVVHILLLFVVENLSGKLQ